MWNSFVICIIVGAGLMLVPGYPISRLLLRSRFGSLATAPLVSIAGYAFAGTIYTKLGISCTWKTMVLPLLFLAAVCFFVNVFSDRKSGRSLISSLRLAIKQGSLLKTSSPWFFLPLYLIVAVVVVTLFYVKCFDGADSFVVDYDNAFHVGIIRTFLDTGDWSPLGASLYAGTDGYPEEGVGGFYPAAWHIFTTIIVDITSCAIPVGANASMTLFLVEVFPIAMLYLMIKIFPDNKNALFAGSICIFAFAAFPWRPLMVPLISQMASYCMTPALLGLFIEMASAPRYPSIIRQAVLFVIALLALVLTQTNVIFTSMVFLFPYCVHKIWSLPLLSKGVSGFRKKILSVFLLTLVFFCVWMALYFAPFMQGVVNFTWKAFLTQSQAIINILVLSFRDSNAQIVLAFLVIAGFVIALLHPDTRWLSVSYLLFCVMFFIGATSDGLLKHIIDGFWYTDRTRLASNAVFCAMPLAALGLGRMAGYFLSYLQRHAVNDEAFLPLLVNSLVCILAAIIIFYPSFSVYGIGEIETAFGKSKTQMESMFSKRADSVYSEEERAFIEKVKEAIPEGALVINQPTDGSAFAYAANGLNVYYRSFYQGNTPSGETIRKELSNIDASPEIGDLIENIDAQYVLQLDANNNVQPNVSWHYDPDKWTGIDAIDEHTPGFELVLNEGDMRLFKIVR